VHPDALKGSLLVATPTLLDPNFRRTVVLLLEHTKEGAVGVVLNRPSLTATGEAIPDLAEVVADDDPVFIGGPVSPGSVIALGDHREVDELDDVVCGTVAAVEFGTSPEELAEQVTRVRAFAGYAGWGSGQLEGEIEEEAWITAAALADDVFTADPDELWSRVLERMGNQYALLARMPDDPRMN
jgi:putative transcriptional regulator